MNPIETKDRWLAEKLAFSEAAMTAIESVDWSTLRQVGSVPIGGASNDSLRGFGPTGHVARYIDSNGIDIVTGTSIRIGAVCLDRRGNTVFVSRVMTAKEIIQWNQWWGPAWERQYNNPDR